MAYIGNKDFLIDGQLTAEITSQYDSIGLVTDGTNWYIL